MIHGPIPVDRFLAYRTWPEIAALPDRDRAVVVLPVGAIEQHGPHLPLTVDSAIVNGVLGRALEWVDRLRPEAAVYALPPLHYGKSNEHDDFPGTFSLSATTLLATVMELGDSLYRSGFRKLLILNGHGGQPQVLEIAATDLRVKHPDLTIAACFVWRSADYKPLVNPAETVGMHAGDAETCLMLAIDPDRVRMDRAVAEMPPTSGDRLGIKGPLARAWRAIDLTQSGVIGDPTAATADRGEQLLDLLGRNWAEILLELYDRAK